ncbi:MAG TPA: hypothetical protein DIU07_21340 [Rhodobacteraceae bacterium]|nr:hypothetical protein [Paracoccaceae bacterium]
MPDVKDIYLISDLPGLGDTIGVAATGADVVLDPTEHTAEDLSEAAIGFSTAMTTFTFDGADTTVTEFYQIDFESDGSSYVG